ncbi:branched chain amino acid ABC transporter substrate-binding protein, partial [Burkholderia multivorans]
MTFRLRLLSAAALTVANLALPTDAAHAQEAIVKVGVAVPLTGGGAAYGKDIENGVRMAVDEANAARTTIGGKPVKFVIASQDDQSDPRIGVQAAQ